MSAVQYQRLIALLDSSSPTPVINHLSTSSTPVTGFCNSICSENYVSWIIDSGATDHICCSLELFSSYHSISPITVRLTTRSHVMASHSGTVTLSPTLILHNVLFLPNFSFNIISVSRLTASSACFLTFYSSFCQIHSLHPLLMIGSAKHFEGLYILTADKNPPAPSGIANLTTTSNDSAFTLWHHRLGHLSHSTFSQLHKTVSDISCNSHFLTCDTCHFAKQKCLSFPVSKSSCNKIFELIHVDIWGPYSISSIQGHRYFLTIVDDFSRFTWLFLMPSKSDA